MMNEITRIHIAKVAYDIEIGAKKELEKYIKSLETYTQDTEVLADIEIRMTELLADRAVLAGQVISSQDVAAIRKQLGEPYEFADEDGDIAVGTLSEESNGRRLYRSLNDAVLGGVLSGMAAYFKVNPLWTRLIFILITFISFGFALLLYIVLWVIIPPARTAAEKLQLAGKPVTLESIRQLNLAEEANQSRSFAPILLRILRIGVGIASILAALTTLALTIWGIVAVVSQNTIPSLTDRFLYTGTEYSWVPWLLFWIIIAGMLLLTALFVIVAYALLAKKFTKKLLVTGIVVVCLGIVSVAAVTSISATQSWRVQSEAQSSVQTTKLNLPKDFASVQSLVLESPTKSSDASYYTALSSIQYVVDEGAPRYELTGLPKTKVIVKLENQTAHLSLDIPEDYRNAFVQPNLVIYGPALNTLETNGVRTSYSNVASQGEFKVALAKNYNDVTVNGTFQSVIVSGKGTLDLSSSAIQVLTINSEQDLSVRAGTVRELSVSQPEVCASSTYNNSTSVTVSGVTSGMMTYNGKQIAAASFDSNCASVVVGDEDEINE